MSEIPTRSSAGGFASQPYVPTVDEFLKDVPTVDDFLKTVNRNQEYRGYDPQFGIFDGETFDEMFGKGGPGYVLNKFGQGLVHGWGTRGIGDTEAPPGDKSLQETLRGLGLYNDWAKGEKSWIKAFNESLLRSAAMGADLALRVPSSLFSAGVGAIAGGVEQVTGSESLARDIEALPEAFPAGPMLGYNPRIHTPSEYIAGGRRPGQFGVPEMPRSEMLEKAQGLDIIPGRDPSIVAMEQLAPDQSPVVAERDILLQKQQELQNLRRSLDVQTLNVGDIEIPSSARLFDIPERVAAGGYGAELAPNRVLRDQLDRDLEAINRRIVELTRPEGSDISFTAPEAPFSYDTTPIKPVEPGDIHGHARLLAPEAFKEFDSITGQRQELSNLLNDLADERTLPAQQRVDDILEKVNGIESRLTRAQTLRLALARKELEEIQGVDSPTMAEVRRQLQELDYRRRDLAPEISEAYRRAQSEVLPAVEGVRPVEGAPAELPLRTVEQAAQERPGVELSFQGEPTRVPPPERPAEPVVVRAPITVTRRGFIKDFTQDGVVDLPGATRALADQVKTALSEGRTVTAIRGRERTRITSGEDGVLRDASGAEWDTTPFATESGRNIRVEISGSRTGGEAPREVLPPARGPEGLPPVQPGMVRFYHGGVVAPRAGEARWLSQDYNYARDYRQGAKVYYVDLPETSPHLIKAFDDTGTAQKSPYVNFEAPPEIAARLKPVEAMPRPRELSQPARSVSRDAYRRLVLAGRTPEQARVEAAVTAAYYNRRAQRLQTTGWDLYQNEGPMFRRGGTRREPSLPGDLEQPRRGKISLGAGPSGRNLITFFKNADGSTFIHEFGHNILEEMLRDAEHPLASADLREDVKTVRDWLGVKEGTLPKSAHEMFARGLERYFMEGVAPTSKLAAIFEKFKNWFIQIYRSVDALNAPINDDIRDVYARLFTENKEPVIFPDRPGMDFATAAEETARSVPLADAADAADRIRQERDAIGQAISKAIDDARRRARGGPEGTGVPEGGRITRVGGPEREGAVAPDAAVGESGSVAPGKSKPPTSSTSSFPNDGKGGLTDGTGNVMIENLNTKGDIEAALKQAVAETNGGMRLTRSVLSDVEVDQLSDDLGGIMPSKIDRHEVGQTFNAEEIRALRRLLVEMATDVKNLKQAAASGDLDAIINHKIAEEKLMMAVEVAMGIRAETGRALRAWHMLKGVTGDVPQFQDLLQRMFQKTPEDLKREAALGLALDTPAKIIANTIKDRNPTWKDMVVEAWINSILSGPWTHVRNVVGNAALVVNAPIESLGAAVVSAIRAPFRGGERAVSFNEAADMVRSLAQGGHEGVIAFAKNIRDENVAFAGDGRQVDIAKKQAIPSSVPWMGYDIPLGSVIRLPTRTLAAEDAFFKAIAWRQQVTVLARRRARFEGLDGPALDARIIDLLRDPPPDIIEGANRFAEVQTFTNQLGAFGRGMTQLADAHPFLRLIIPFVRTPTNIIKYVGHRTPFGLASRHVWDSLLGKNGEVARDSQIARLALGTAVMAGIGMWAWNDGILGGAPMHEGERDVWMASGKRPYTIRAGDTYLSYRGFGPQSILMAAAADATDLVRRGLKGEEWDKLGTMMALAFSRDFVNQGPLSSLSNAFQMLAEPEGHVARFFNGMLRSFAVPAFVNQTAQMIDPLHREIRGTIDTLKAAIPGLRGSIEPTVDLWGRAVIEPDYGPVRGSPAYNDPITQMMARLDMGKSLPDKKIEGIDLTPRQYHDYAVISGQWAKKRLDDMLPQLERMPDYAKKVVINKTFDAARKMARSRVMMGSLGTDNDITAKAVKTRLDRINAPSPTASPVP